MIYFCVLCRKLLASGSVTNERIKLNPEYGHTILHCFMLNPFSWM